MTYKENIFGILWDSNFDKLLTVKHSLNTYYVADTGDVAIDNKQTSSHPHKTHPLV